MTLSSAQREREEVVMLRGKEGEIEFPSTERSPRPVTVNKRHMAGLCHLSATPKGTSKSGHREGRGLFAIARRGHRLTLGAIHNSRAVQEKT